MKLLLLMTTLLCVLAMSAFGAENQKGTAPARSCTDLAGDPVPCPEGHNQVVLPSAKKGSAEVRRCVDLLGNEVPCPGENPAPSESANDAGTAAPTTTSSSATASSSSATSSVPADSKQAVSVVPASSTKTSAMPAESTVDTSCHDLLGQPVSCPVDAPSEAAATGNAGATSNGAGRSSKAANESSSGTPIYVEPTTKPQPSLERSLPRNIYLGQKEFWTYPLHMRLDDAYWAVPFGITTGGLIAADVSIKNELPQSPSTIKNFKSISNYGALAYGALVGGSYLYGRGVHNSYMSDTAWLAGEAGLNSFITTYALKYAFGRQRPTEGNGQGDFFSGGQSFPSEHSAAVWSVATVFAGRYPGTLTKLGMFGGAALISASRVIGQQHFMSDAFIGSAMGFYFGRQALKRYQQEHATDAMYGSFVQENPSPSHNPANMGSTFVPLDSWVYPVFDRLAAQGIVRTGFWDMRPWTRMECARLLIESADRLGTASGFTGEGNPDLIALRSEFAVEIARREGREGNLEATVDSVYARIGGIVGRPLRDGFHSGQTITNDYGRPYGEGVNAIAGTSVYATAGPFSAYVRGEYQRSGTNLPYTPAQQQAIAEADLGGAVPPANPFPQVSRARLLDAYIAYTFKGTQLSFGQRSLWWGPPRGGAMLYTNNAEPIPMASVDTVSPFNIPLLGPARVSFFVGRLNGQQYILADPGTGTTVLYGPGVEQPYIHGEKFAFKPTPNFEFSVGRTAIFGGPYVPFTSRTFFKSMFSSGNTLPGQANDPGDRRSTVDFSYRIPGLRNWLTFYVDALAEDESSPLFFPRRSAFNPGLYIPQLPKLHKLDFRAEGVYTNLPNLVYNSFFYFNGKYRNGYTNYSDLMASWIGRQGAGGQAFATYTFSPQNTLQVGFRTMRVDKSFLEGGSLTDVNAKGDFFLRKDLSLSTFVQFESWKFPFLASTPQRNTTVSVQVTFWPKHLGSK